MQAQGITQIHITIIQCLNVEVFFVVFFFGSYFYMMCPKFVLNCFFKIYSIKFKKKQLPGCKRGADRDENLNSND